MQQGQGRPAAGPSWLAAPGHRRWLRAEQDRLVGFQQRVAGRSGVGFAPLDATGEPTEEDRPLYATARLVHCFALEHLLGRPGAAEVAEHGLAALTGPYVDDDHGGWVSALAADGSVADDSKSAYGHAFVILAAASARQAGLSGADRLLADALQVVDQHLWRDDEGGVVEACTRDWQVVEPDYRGQNANMHLTEAYLAAHEATGDPEPLRRAERIAARLINEHARACEWRVPEHFGPDWAVRPDYNIDRPADQFRPYGTVVGHAFEWARLVLQLESTDGAEVDWAAEAAAGLFNQGVTDGWIPDHGGVLYSVDFDGRPVNTDRMHWVMAEAVGAAWALRVRTGDDQYETWYRRFWGDIERHLIDVDLGSWWHQRAADGGPKSDTWAGKPDLYHAWQATLYARIDGPGGIGRAALEGRIG